MIDNSLLGRNLSVYLFVVNFLTFVQKRLLNSAFSTSNHSTRQCFQNQVLKLGMGNKQPEDYPGFYS